MKKKIMAFLLAAAMVVGSATTASAVNLGVIGVDKDRTTKKGPGFTSPVVFNFKDNTDTNRYTAAWASQSDVTSKALAEAWQNGQKVSRMTAIEKNWETYGAYNWDDVLENTEGVYGQWISGKWDKAETFATNMRAITDEQRTAKTGDTVVGIGYDYLVQQRVFASTTATGCTDPASKAMFRGNAAVILKADMQKVIDAYAAVQALNDGGHSVAEISAAVAKAEALCAEGKLVRTDVAWSEMNSADKIAAFVTYTGKDTIRQSAVAASAVTDRYGDYVGREFVNTDGTYDFLVSYKDGVYTYYDVISPLEALYTYNESSTLNANLWVAQYSGQQYDLYEVIIGGTAAWDCGISLEDANFKYLWAGKNAAKTNTSNVNPWASTAAAATSLAAPISIEVPKDKFLNVRIWKWNNQFSRQTWVERKAMRDKANNEVIKAWKDAVSPKMIEAYNAAAEKAGLALLNDDAKVGDIFYMDIVPDGADRSNTYTLLYGTVAKDLSNGKAVKVLHWVNNKEWKAVPAEMVRLYTNTNDDTWGILMEENTYSPFIVIEIEDEGTGVDATADAAKTPEKSGKTGVSFLGL